MDIPRGHHESCTIVLDFDVAAFFRNRGTAAILAPCVGGVRLIRLNSAHTTFANISHTDHTSIHHLYHLLVSLSHTSCINKGLRQSAESRTIRLYSRPVVPSPPQSKLYSLGPSALLSFSRTPSFASTLARLKVLKQRDPSPLCNPWTEISLPSTFHHLLAYTVFQYALTSYDHFDIHCLYCLRYTTPAPTWHTA